MSYEHKPHKTNAHQKQHTPKERKEDSKSAQSYRYVAYVSFSESKKVYTFGCDVNTYKVGDKVITSKYSGTEVKIDGEEYTIVRQSDILAVVE